MPVYNSDSVTETLISAIQALGAPTPTSFGLGELMRDFDNALAAFHGGVGSVTNSDGTIITVTTSGNVVISRAAITGDIAVPEGSSTSALEGTEGTESIIRAQQWAQLSMPTTAVPMGGQNFVMLGAANTLSQAWQYGQRGTLLDGTIYQPSPTTQNTSSSTPSAIDSTNLTVGPFLATTTGAKVLLAAACSNFGDTNNYNWTLFNHGDTTPICDYVQPLSTTGGTQTIGMYVTAYVVVTGLTIGTSYQWDWAHAAFTGTGIIGYGSTSANPIATASPGPAIMEVYAA